VTALLDQILDELQGAWRFRWLALAVAAGVAFVGWSVVFALPDLYEADAKIFVDSSTALKPVLQGLAVEQDVNAELNYVRQSLLAGPQFVKIARESGVLPASVTDPRRKAAILDDFSRRVIINVSTASSNGQNSASGGTIYQIRYQDRNRARSLTVVATLLRTLVDETLGGKQAAAQSAQSFLEQQIQAYGKRLNAAEARLAAFKKGNIGLLPTEQGGYFTELQTELTAITKDQIDMEKARARRRVLEGQLHGDIAVAAAGSTPSGAAGTVAAPGSDIDALIAQAQEKLDALKLRYTDKHPDVIAEKQILAELKQRRATEIASLKNGDANAAAITGASSNPVYQSIEQQLNQTDLKLADLSTDLAQHRVRAAQLKALLNTAPQVEARYEQLTRDYAVNTAEYNALLKKYEKARLGEQAGNAGAVRFEIVEPPTANYAPVWPKRLRLIAGILVAALLIGGGLAYGLNQLRPAIQSAASLAALTGVPVLGVVGTAHPQRARRRRLSERRRFALAGLGFLTAFVLAVMLSLAGFRLSGHLLKTLVNT
jgi:polysaccharide chain length determinant protein (PEP-CTERM system associated)